jgi:tRNA nucleotidyltransferase (CCA-adding enzyme)
MDIILSHNNLDCDGLAAMVAMSRLRPGAIPVLLGSQNRNVRDLIERYAGLLRSSRLRDLPKQPLERIILVDTQQLPSDESLQRRILASRPTIEIYDHHPRDESAVPAEQTRLDTTGATTTMLIEDMQQQGIHLSSQEATILLLGIYEDTGHLTYTTTTPRDVRAAAWLLEQGADLKVVADYIDRPLSTRQWDVYETLQANAAVEHVNGYAILLTTARAPDYVEEISTLAHKLTDLYDPDASFVLVQMEMDNVVQVIARSRNAAIDVAAILKPLGGGGHAPAAAALVRGRDLHDVKTQLWDTLRQGLAPAVTAADLMTRELHAISTGTSIADAYDALRRYGHEALPILDNDRLVGLITRRDADKAMLHGLGDRPVEAFATFDMPTITPRTSLIDIQDTMQQNNIGQLPVLDGGRLVGIVTRTDVIGRWRATSGSLNLADRLKSALAPDVLKLLTIAGDTASSMGFSLYLVGGFVRDLLLGLPNADLDLVVEGDAIALAEHLASDHGGRTMSHSRFGTAKWIVAPGEGNLSLTRSLTLDFVTARTEFYEYPAALPHVEASSLRHDLYRRDFTINTMAIRLNGARYGELIDFYGGKDDLDRKLIRVLHNLSFIDDATRILRAARLAERLGFTIEERTRALIAGAWDALDRVSGDRLRHELKLIFQEETPERIIRRLDELGVLQHLHGKLAYSPWLADCYQAVRTALPTWQAWGWGDGGRGGDKDTALMAAYMAILAYALSPDELDELMARLNVGGSLGFVLRQVWALRAHVADLASGLRPSQIYHLLQPYTLEAIFVIYITEASPPLREAILSYVQRLRHVRTVIDGSLLRAMGIPTGPLYGRLLQAILDARLDGLVQTRTEEEQLLGKLLAQEQAGMD